MNNFVHQPRQDVREIEQLLVHAQRLHPGELCLFTDLIDFLATIFNKQAHALSALTIIGHATPEILLAADKASLRVNEYINSNPFRYQENQLSSIIKSGKELVYLANPNRLTGASFSLQTIREILQSLPSGFLVVDEYYFDYFGITAKPLIAQFPNLVILRSAAASFGIYSSDCGYAIASAMTLANFREEIMPATISTLSRRMLTATVTSDDVLTLRLREIHEESLRLAKALMSLGIPSRIIATDSLLFQVRSPKDVGNELYRRNILVENLDGYPGLKGYLRYRLESPLSNDNFLASFKSMPSTYYQRRHARLAPQTLRRPGETVSSEPDNGISDLNRLKSETTVSDEHNAQVTTIKKHVVTTE